MCSHEDLSNKCVYVIVPKQALSPRTVRELRITRLNGVACIFDRYG